MTINSYKALSVHSSTLENLVGIMLDSPTSLQVAIFESLIHILVVDSNRTTYHIIIDPSIQLDDNSQLDDHNIAITTPIVMTIRLTSPRGGIYFDEDLYRVAFSS